MLHAYVDESYTDDWFFMAAAIGDDKQVATFNNNMPWLVIEAAEYLGLPTVPNELHGYELLQGAGPWSSASVQARIDLAAQALELARECDIKFILRGLDRKAQRQKYNEVYEPYGVVLTQLAKDVNAFARARSTPVDIVCDEIHHDDRHRAMIERWRRNGTPGYTVSKLQSVVGSLEFVASDSSGMIQVADLVAYLRHRIATRPDPPRAERRARDRLWRIIEGQIDQNYVWVP
ncbi:DUF3800 domain-containing protein [Nocardioides sp. SR21]|uniref:DUF3800 domain-containing protein n=1 Tax=Nocardioides sp. SR21 TaxID=2919501 RepID=UPI001FA9916A|nr:DUF3800 domain-containing protein [Nocardioides sp. SR21]